MRGADLTPTDETVALLLLAAHQRNMRKRHIKRQLAGKTCCKGALEICNQRDVQLPDAMTQPDKLQPHNYPQADGADQEQQSKGPQLDDCHAQGQQNSQSHQSTVSIVDPALPNASMSSASSPQAAGNRDSDERLSHWDAILQHDGVAEGQQQAASEQEPGSRHVHDVNTYAQTQQQQQQQQANIDPDAERQQAASQNSGSIHGSKPSQTKKSRRPILKEIHLPTGVDVEQGWGRGSDTDDSDVGYDDDGDVAVFEDGRGCGFPCVLTPSSLAAQLAPHLTDQQAAEIYLGKPPSNCYSDALICLTAGLPFMSATT